jgi:hypothetical protein
MRRFCTVLAVGVALFVIAQPAAYGASVTGAIFTTLADGSAVNANHFDSKCAVHLDGGPGPNAPARAAGLPDGDYYFQVTDPSGRHLLNTDPVSNRKFRVTGGVITAYIGTGGPAHPTGVDLDHGAVTIALANATCPTDFLDSTNNGGAYKVWATPVADFVGDPTLVDNTCGNGCFHGFVPSKSKTDNFKARISAVTFCLTLQKEIVDSEGNVSPGNNWEMSVFDPLGSTNLHYTDESGQVQICGLPEGNYTVTESGGSRILGLVVNGVPAAPENVQPIYSFAWSAGRPAPVILFQNRAFEVE